ncbi:MAG: SIMPL domain-containing protein [Bacteroidota bacterium]
MKNIRRFSFVITLTITSALFGQTKTETEEKSFIEVTGTAEQEIVPDEIYISITIKERFENKEKLTIEVQDDKLKAALKEIGLNLENLYLSDANASYVKIKWRTKDVLTKKDFTLKVNNGTTVGQVFQQLDKLDIKDAEIDKVNHSKIDSLKKEVRIMAIKAAKAKANYLLAAIGEQTGKPLIVQEKENLSIENLHNLNIRGARSSGASFYVDGQKIIGGEIQFQKIKIQSAIYVKFLIK